MQVPSVYQPSESLRLQQPNFYAATLKMSAFLSLIMSIAAVISIAFIQPEIPLFYSLSQPDRQLAPKVWLFFFPAISWLVTFSHFTLVKTLKDLEHNIQKIFCWTTFMIISIISLMFVRVLLLAL